MFCLRIGQQQIVLIRPEGSLTSAAHAMHPQNSVSFKWFISMILSLTCDARSARLLRYRLRRSDQHIPYPPARIALPVIRRKMLPASSYSLYANTVHSTNIVKHHQCLMAAVKHVPRSNSSLELPRVARLTPMMYVPCASLGGKGYRIVTVLLLIVIVGITITSCEFTAPVWYALAPHHYPSSRSSTTCKNARITLLARRQRPVPLRSVIAPSHTRSFSCTYAKYFKNRW